MISEQGFLLIALVFGGIALGTVCFFVGGLLASVFIKADEERRNQE